METLLDAVRKNRPDIRDTVNSRMKEFREKGKAPARELFRELCFCLMTANFSAKRAIAIQDEIGDGFFTLPENELAERLRKAGHRYPNARARYITEARKHISRLNSLPESGHRAREWLVENIKGLGYKEASHFLRNIGYKNLAIVDFHIADVLERYSLAKRPRTMTPKKYMEMEHILGEVAARLGMSPGELDLYLWYMETGTVLK